jgi:S1-C subfamily serine protease
VILAEGDIDLTRTFAIKDSIFRASGEIRLPANERARPQGCTIEAHAKNPTAPYKFFELTDLGLDAADDEEGLVVSGVKADTPFGNGGLAKGDVVLAIDDVPVAGSQALRTAVRRALVRQGNCLVTIARNGKTVDLPIFFPLPK